MKNKHTLISSILTLCPMFIGFLIWNRLPEDIATHFNFQGIPDGYNTKFFVVVCLPFILLGIHLVCLFFTDRDPLDKNSDIVVNLVSYLIPFISFIVYFFLYSYALGYRFDVIRYILLLCGVLYIVIGLILPSIKPNRYIGMKYPWTYKSDENWYKTHVFSQYILVIIGVLWMIEGIVKVYLLPFLIISLVIMTVLPGIYSYLIYKNEKS